MNYQKPVYPLIFLLTFLTLNFSSSTRAAADNPANICRRLPTIPAPQTTSTLRLLTAYAMPTIVARLGSWQNETDYIYQKLNTNAQSQTIRDFARTAQPYHWEISLFWNFSRLPTERTLTPLTESYQHHETRLHEAYKICRSLDDRFDADRRSTRSSAVHNTPLLDQMLLTLEQQRITALLHIYAPQTFISQPSHFPASSIATGKLP